ncbi:MAG: hypothetical protein AAF570_08285, partial [Bacteroidota bacterium]
DDLFSEENAGFGEGFSDRVAQRLSAPADEDTMAYFLPRLFKWVAAAGTAAAIVLLMLTWTAEESLSMDAFAGISSISLDDVTALNNF